MARPLQILRRAAAYLRALVALVASQWTRPQRVEITERAPRKGYPPKLYTSKSRARACFVDGSARGGRAGFGVYYADGDARNRSLALPPRVGATPGANNIAEISAIFHAVFCAARNSPLDVYSDSALALRTLKSGAATTALAPPGAALARAVIAILRLRGAETSLSAVAAHADVAGNHVADALAQAGAERGELFAVPEAFYDGGGLGTWLAIRHLELVYLLRAGDEEGSSSIWA